MLPGLENEVKLIVGSRGLALWQPNIMARERGSVDGSVVCGTSRVPWEVE